MAIINYDGISGISSITATGSSVQFYNAAGIGSMVINPAGNALAGISSISTNVITASSYNINFYTPIQNVSFSSNIVSGTFTLPVKCNCLFLFSGMSYTGGAATITLTLSITGIGNIATANGFSNESGSHKTVPTSFASYTLNPGTYTVVITSSNSNNVDDKGNCALIAIPTL